MKLLTRDRTQSGSQIHGVPCPLCRSKAVRYLPLSHTQVWKCTRCALQFASPQIDDRNLIKAYENIYYPVDGNRHGSVFENTSGSIHRQVFHRLENLIGRLAGLRLLDYGCGIGSLLRVSLEFGVEATGVEPDPQARSAARRSTGSNVYSDIEELRMATRGTTFDLIVLWTVIEHLRRPWEDLAKLRLLLAPGGSLLISTINTRCLRARIERRRWVQYQNPTHFYYFDRTSLAGVIRAAGFSDLSHWRLKIRFPHHGLLRRWLYHATFAVGLADGLFYLCRANDEFKTSSPELAADHVIVNSAQKGIGHVV